MSFADHFLALNIFKRSKKKFARNFENALSRCGKTRGDFQHQGFQKNWRKVASSFPTYSGFSRWFFIIESSNVWGDSPAISSISQCPVPRRKPQ